MSRLATSPMVALVLVLSCAGERPTDDGRVSRVENGKADDYYSDVAAELEVRGELRLEAPAEADEAAVRALALGRVNAAVVYLTAFITMKLEGFYTNLDYGGHAAMVRNRTAEALEVVEERVGDPNELGLRAANELSYEELDAVLDRRAAQGIVAGRPFQSLADVLAVRFVGPVSIQRLRDLGMRRFAELRRSVRFSVDVAGPRDLGSLLGERFDLRMPAGATSDARGSLGTVRGFDPERYQGELEAVPCQLFPIPAARNGYPEYAAFFEDGVFDLTLFQGHDYNAERTDLWESFVLYYYLTQSGFDESGLALADEPDQTVLAAIEGLLGEQAPDLHEVAVRAARLRRDSGPLVKTLLVGDREVRAEVRIFHSEMFRDDRPGQRALALAELVSRDVFFYNGHAGPWYGFYLDGAGRAEVREDDFARAAFTDRQQLFVANGCQTYSQYADMLYAHPDKDEGNLDVITTVNFSVGRGSDMLVLALTQTDWRGHHVAWSYGDLIRAFNEEQVNAERQVFYGVTGIDENPRVHPYANLEAIGRPCASSWDCGDPHGNACDGTCGAVALSAEACPENTAYVRFASEDVIQGGACWR